MQESAEQLLVALAPLRILYKSHEFPLRLKYRVNTAFGAQPGSALILEPFLPKSF